VAAGPKELAAILRLTLRGALPIAAELAQALVAQPAEQDIVGPCVLGVLLEAIALEELRLVRAAADLLLARRAERQAEDRQSAVLAPVLGEAARDSVGHFFEADLLVLRERGARRDQRDEQNQQQKRLSHKLHHRINSMPDSVNVLKHVITRNSALKTQNL